MTHLSGAPELSRGSEPLVRVAIRVFTKVPDWPD